MGYLVRYCEVRNTYKGTSNHGYCKDNLHNVTRLRLGTSLKTWLLDFTLSHTTIQRVFLSPEKKRLRYLLLPAICTA
jgi:hypothetical protein